LINTWSLNEQYTTSAGSVSAGRTGSGPDLVLAHGWPWSSYSWHRIIPPLSQNFRVHWYDMPGYGQSIEQADLATSLDIQGAVFAEMLSHWQLDRPRVIAHDMGGATTLRAHLLHDCDYERYILMNVVAVRPWGSEFFDHVGKHIDAFTGLPPHIHQALVEAYIKGALTNSLAGNDLEMMIKPWLSAEGSDSFYRQFEQADERYTAEIEPLYGELRCLTKIIWGEDDPWIPLERAKVLHEMMPAAEFATLSKTGHLPQLENPDKLLQEVISFL